MGLELMPFPAKVTVTEGRFQLSDSFQIRLEGAGGERLERGANRWLLRLTQATGLFLAPEVFTNNFNRPAAPCVIQCRRTGKLTLGEDESYQLSVSAERILLTAETDLGALHGLETLLQLLHADSEGYFFPAIVIEDAPRFAWRGLLIDVGRHFMSVDVIKRNLDGMAAVKMNVLHWHLTEDQGFRVECKTFPRLHELGSDGQYYTQEQIREIIDYAADRGIRVVPEFDMPGHATSWFVGYPELASAPGPYQIQRGWGIFDPAMNPAQEKTYRFLDRFFKEMARLFPDEYVHIGGDENNGRQWSANSEIQAFMKKNQIPNNHALQAHFNRRIHKLLAKHGKRMIGWDEILDSHLPKDIVIHSWRGRQSLVQAAQTGYPVILSHGYYIDLIQSTEYHYLNDPLPADTPLKESEARLVLGGEATMWSEFVSGETIDSRIWPRTAAIAERLWSPATVRDVADMYRRLERISFHLEKLGLQHEKNYEMMLRRLTNNTDITALKTLVDVIEPVKNYNRPAQRKHTSFSPLTRVVDAARPDAPMAREFRWRIERLLSSAEHAAGELTTIREQLLIWKNNHAALLTTIRMSPMLKEITTLSEDLSIVAGIGLEALGYLMNGTQADQNWMQGSLAKLQQAKQPRGQSELMIVDAVEKLVWKAAGVKDQKE
ncbi:MAG: family 20 glycosylhydrolase [candidate division KSB1 bacterium]|nr:family 20 glycosylhydrolase [candidate division KSB1 bacterium]